MAANLSSSLPGLTPQVGFTRLAALNNAELGQARVLVQSMHLRKKIDARGSSAFTRVHSPSKTGVNALTDALLPTHDGLASSLHPQQPIDTPGIFPEHLARLHLQRARMRQLDAEIVGHARGAGGEDDHTGAEKHRLSYPVGDKDNGFLRLLPDAQQLEVHLLARERVERAERLVHEDELGIVDERTRDRGALLHAAGELVWVHRLLALEPDQREEVAGARAALRHRQPENFRRQQHVVDHAPPFEEERLLEHHADVARRIERLRGGADLD